MVVIFCCLYISLLRGIVCKYFLHCRQIPFSVIISLLFLIHFQVNPRTLYCYFALRQHYFLTIGRLSVTEARTNVKIGTQKNSETADYLTMYSAATQANLFRNDMVDKWFYGLTRGGVTNIYLFNI